MKSVCVGRGSGWLSGSPEREVGQGEEDSLCCSCCGTVCVKSRQHGELGKKGRGQICRDTQPPLGTTTTEWSTSRHTRYNHYRVVYK